MHLLHLHEFYFKGEVKKKLYQDSANEHQLNIISTVRVK